MGDQEPRRDPSGAGTQSVGGWDGLEKRIPDLEDRVVRSAQAADRGEGYIFAGEISLVDSTLAADPNQAVVTISTERVSGEMVGDPVLDAANTEVDAGQAHHSIDDHSEA